MNDIKLKIGYYLLKRKAAARERKVKAVHLYSAKKAAILLNNPVQSEFEMIKKFVFSLQELGVDVTVAGFIPEKKIPNFFLLRKGYVFFGLEHLNWYYKPIGSFVDSFLKEKFDIMIDLSLERSFPVDYLSELSDAGFKAGKFFREGPEFDLTIDTSGNNTLAFLLDQMEHYLSLINKPLKHETTKV